MVQNRVPNVVQKLQLTAGRPYWRILQHYCDNRRLAWCSGWRDPCLTWASAKEEEKRVT